MNIYKNNKPFLWTHLENPFIKSSIEMSYEISKDYNIIIKNSEKIPATMDNIFFRKTLTKTMVKKETDDEDPS